MKFQAFAVFAAVCGAGVSAGLVAHADPGDAPAAPPPDAADSGVKVLPSKIACGQPYTANVDITNPSGAAIAGKIVFTVGAVTNTYPFEAAPSVTKHLHVPLGKNLNCLGPLGIPKVEVFKGADKLESKNLSPTTFTASRSFPEVSGKLSVRRMQVEGTCGAAVHGEADLFLEKPPAQTAQFDLTFENAPPYKPRYKAVVVNPTTPSTVKIESPNVDCQGANGIPMLRYYLKGAGAPVPPTIAVSADSVVFEPG